MDFVKVPRPTAIIHSGGGRTPVPSEFQPMIDALVCDDSDTAQVFVPFKDGESVGQLRDRVIRSLARAGKRHASGTPYTVRRHFDFVSHGADVTTWLEPLITRPRRAKEDQLLVVEPTE